jgi:glycosyltransferase involved in cell wall biosynthesis
MFSSTIIASIGRASLSRAVESVLDQEFDQDFEVVVVNDSARPLAPAAWQQSPRVQVVDTQARERAVARNTGAAVARGTYLHFMDDDDWLLPCALQLARERSATAGDAVCLTGRTQVVDGTDRVWGELDFALDGNCAVRLLAGAYLLIGSYFVRSDAFFAAGGFDRSFGGSEDVHLPIRLALAGDFARIPAPIVAILRGLHWSTSTDYSKAVEENRLIRDAALDLPGAFGRLRASADSPYWKGRLVHAYGSSCLLSWRYRRPFKFLSRSLHASAVLLASGPALANGSFWRGVRDDQLPGGLSEVMERIDRAMSAGSSGS